MKVLLPYEDEKQSLFFDNLTGTYFESTMEKVLDAEYRLNSRFRWKGFITVYEYLLYFGIFDQIPRYSLENDGRDSGWETWAFPLLDFNHEIEEMDEGPDRDPLVCYVIDIRYKPIKLLRAPAVAG